MIVYSILIAMTLAGNFFIKVRRKFFLIFMLCILFCVAAIRFDVGTDYIYYKTIYSWITNGAGQFIAKGFYNLTLFISKLPTSYNYQILIAISALPLYVALYKYIVKYLKKEQYQFALFLFITSGMAFSSYNIFRQYIAIAFGMMAVYLFEEKKIMAAITMFIIAILFHKIAIVFLLLVILNLLSKTKYFFPIVMSVYIISVLVIIIDIRVVVLQILKLSIFDNWEAYSESKFLIEKNSSAILKLIIPNISFLLFTFFGNSYMKDIKKYREVLSGFLCYTFFNNAFYGIIVLTRIGECFYIYYIIAAVVSTNVFRTELENKIVMWLFISYYVLLTVVTIFIMGGHGVMPYNIFLNK